MPDFEGLKFNKEQVHTTDLLQGKISLMSFVLAQYAEVRTHHPCSLAPWLTLN